MIKSFIFRFLFLFLIDIQIIRILIKKLIFIENLIVKISLTVI